MRPLSFNLRHFLFSGLMAILFSFPFSSSGQSSNAYLTVTHMGYNGGEHLIRINNKQSCTVDIQLKYHNITVESVQPNWKNNVNHNSVPPGISEIRVKATNSNECSIEIKALSICNWQGNSTWLTIYPPAAMPVKFTGIRYTKINNRQVRIEFDVRDAENLVSYDVMISPDGGKTWKKTKVVFPDKIQPNKTYVAVVDIK